MGRQSYITRLALGRSPFEAPELNESNEFILGQYAHEFDNPDGYIQQFNERGHPENRASRAAARELRRAKNDVLSTVGVVVSKNDNGRNAWRKKTDKQKIDTVIRENEYGLALAALDLGLMFVSLWWLVSLRRRIQTFKSYSSVPLLEVFKFELRTFGFLIFSCAGMPAWAMSWFINTWRYYLNEGSIEWILDRLGAKRSDKASRIRFDSRVNLISQVSNMALFILSAPIQAFALLQSLHLIPQTAVPHQMSLIPFTHSSPIQFPPLPNFVSPWSMLDFGFRVSSNPVILAWTHDYLRHQIESRIYRVIRRTAIKPDSPDELSYRAALEDDMDESTIPGLGPMKKFDRRRSPRPPTLFEELREELEMLQKWLTKVFGWTTKRKSLIPPSSSQHDPEVDASLRLRSAQLQRQYLRQANSPGAREDETRRRQIQRSAVRRAWEERGLSAPPNIDDWISRSSDLGDTASTTTPDPEDLFNLEDLYTGNEAIGHANATLATPQAHTRDPTRASQRGQDIVSRDVMDPISRTNTLFTPLNRSPVTTPPTSPHVRASLIHQDSETVTMQLELLEGRSNYMSTQPLSGNLSRVGSHVSDENGGQHADTDLFDARARHRERSAQRGRPEIERDVVQNTGGADGEIGNRPYLHEVHPPPSIGSAQGDDVSTAAATAGQTGRSEGTRDAFSSTPTEGNAAQDNIDHPADIETVPAASPEHNRLTGARHMSPRRSRSFAEHLNGLEDGETRPWTPASSMHRVTALSNHPSDAFASHASSLLATVFLLPLESLYLRSLTSSFLNHPSARPGAAAAAWEIKADVWGMGDWFGGSQDGVVGRLRYAGLIFLTLGLQNIVSTTVWGLGTAVAIRIGRGFGWGIL